MIGFGDSIMIPPFATVYNPTADSQLLPWGQPVYWGNDQGPDSLVQLSSEYNATLFGLPAGDSSINAMKQRHNGKWNVAFCDGHVESLRPTNLFSITKVFVAQRWNYDHQPHNWLLSPAP
jgi:prepilin-type processing-associated H-X9-DG protein